MIERVIEFPFAPPSQNVWERTNRFRKPRIMLGFRNLIIAAIKEGPWPKLYGGGNLPKVARENVTAELRKRWGPKRFVVGEVTVRQETRRLDADNYHGGCKPLWDGLQWAGWCVTDHVRWLRRIYQPQLRGDAAKTVLQIWVPETDTEEAALKLEHGEE